jgi:hypothetical protein
MQWKEEPHIMAAAVGGMGIDQNLHAADLNFVL